MSSRTFRVREKPMPGFIVSKDRLTVLLRANVTCDLKLKPKFLGFLRMLVNVFCLWSKNETSKPGSQHICLKYDLLNILSLLLRSTTQKKMYLKRLLFIENAPGHSRALMELYDKIHVIFMPAHNIHSAAHGSRSNFDFEVS